MHLLASLAQKLSLKGRTRSSTERTGALFASPRHTSVIFQVNFHCTWLRCQALYLSPVRHALRALERSGCEWLAHGRITLLTNEWLRPCAPFWALIRCAVLYKSCVYFLGLLQQSLEASLELLRVGEHALLEAGEQNSFCLEVWLCVSLQLMVYHLLTNSPCFSPL